MNGPAADPRGPDELDVFVVGAGPVGLTLAADLTRRGLRCRIVDRYPDATPYSKASVIHARQQELLELLGVIDEIKANGHPMRPSRVHAFGLYIGRLDVCGVDSPHPEPWIIGQNVTERILIAFLARHGVAVERPAECTAFQQDATGVTATVRHADGREETVRSRWMVGCDGPRSTVRELAGIAFEGKRYEDAFDFQLGDVTVTPGYTQEEGAVYISPAGGIVLIIPQNGCHRIVVSQPKSQQRPATDAMPVTSGRDEEIVHGTTGEGLTLEELQRLTREHGPKNVVLSNPIWLSRFRVHRRLADRYRVGRVFLAGDAAHVHVPLAGQGMNTGMLDAFNLSWKLALVNAGAAPERLLDSYYAERITHAQLLLNKTESFFLRVSQPKPLFKLLARVVAPIVFPRARIQQRARYAVSQLLIHYPDSPIVVDRRPKGHRGPAAGDRAPDGAIAPTASGATRLFEVLRHPGHTLLLFAGSSPSAAVYGQLAAIARGAAERYGEHVQIHLVTPSGTAGTNVGWEGSVLTDPAGALHQRYGITDAAIYAIRPDWYVGLCCQPPDAAAVARYFANILVDRPAAADATANGSGSRAASHEVATS